METKIFTSINKIIGKMLDAKRYKSYLCIVRNDQQQTLQRCKKPAVASITDLRRAIVKLQYKGTK